MKVGLRGLLFSVVIFFLTAVGLITAYTGTLVRRTQLMLVYMFVFPLVFALAVDLLVEERRWSRKRFLLLTFGIITISIIVTHSVWTILTPRWSFSVSTDKSTYRSGETVKITVCLKNTGFITHSFESRVNKPVVISIEYQYTENPTITSQVWYSPYHINVTAFSIGPNECLERDFIWNQTNIHSPEKEIKPGIYQIKAYVPRAGYTLSLSGNTLWSAWTSINITSSE